MTKARDLADLLDASGNIIAQGTIDGRDIASDGSKLDGIESGATADQTHSEIRALIVDGVDTNVFTDADHTKLDGIEANATADQTASEIRALVESATDSNVFTDADHTKLNAIESGATADQTKADIDALNINADTLDGQHGSYYTGYTDTAVANLVDSAPGTLDTLNELAAALGDDPNFATTTATNIGTKANKTITVSAGSGLTGGGDLTANRTISHADTSSVSDVNGSGNTFIQDIGFDTYGHVTSVGTGTVTVGDGAMTVTAGSGLSGGGQLGTANQSGASSISLSVTDAPKWTTARTLSLSGDASGSTSWDGSGNASISVTVADDSHNHSNYLTSNAIDSLVPSGWTSPSTHAALNIGYNGSGETRAIDIDGGWGFGESKAISFTHGSTDSNLVGQFRVKFDGTGSRMQWGRLYHNGDSSVYPMELLSTSTTAADLNINGNTVWHAGNDGSGSGLDADLLDGLQLTSQTTNNQPNRVVRTQSNGYCEFGWINTTSGDTSSTLSRIYVDTGDGYIRKCTPAHLASQLGGGINVQSVSGTSPTLNVGSFNTFTQDLTANTSISFSNIPTKAKWSYYYYTGNDTNAFSISGLGADGVANSLDSLGPASGNLGSIVSANTTNWLSICSSVYGLGNGNLNVENLALKEDGTILIIQTYNNSVTYFKRFNMSTPFDLSTLSYDAARSGSITLQSTSANRKGDLNGYGYWQQNQNAYSTINTEGVGQYRFTTPWDASTVTGQEFVNFWATSSYSYHSWWGNSGSYYYHVDGSSRIWRYNCSTAYDIRTITGNSGAQNVTDGPGYDTMNGVMSADGTKFYFVNGNSSAIVIKDVTQWQPWTSISTKQEFGAASGNYDRGYNCNPTGYMTFIANNAIIIASLAASYDLSVPSIGATFGGAADTYSRVDFFTSDGGTNIYANAVYNGSKG